MKKKLKDIAEIRTGYQFRGKVSASDDSNVSVIQIKDVDEHLFVDTSDLVPVKIDNPEPYLVSKGDVLFLSRGHRQYAAKMTEPIQNTVATGYFFIMSPVPDIVLPDFLTWTINQPGFHEVLRPFVRGSNVPLISKTDFQEILIELPSLAVQAQIVELYQLFELEQKLSAKIQAKQTVLLRTIAHKLMTGQPQC